MFTKTFEKILCGRTRQKFNFLQGLRPVTSGVQYYFKTALCSYSSFLCLTLKSA